MRSVKTSKLLKPKHLTTIADWDIFLYKSRMFKSRGRPFLKRPGFLPRVLQPTFSEILSNKKKFY